MIHISEITSKNRKSSGLSHRPDAVCHTDRMRSVTQTERNTLETQKETQTGVCEILGLSKDQIAFVHHKTNASYEEIGKALKILKFSKVKNVMSVLLSAAFYKGICILEPDRQEKSKEEQEDEDARGRQAYLDRCTAENKARMAAARAGGNQQQAALVWFQEHLTDDQRQAVCARIVERHPIQKEAVRTGRFGPAMLAFIVLEKLKIERGEVAL